MMAPPRAGEAVPESLAAEIRQSRWFPAKGDGRGTLWFEDVVPLGGDGAGSCGWLAILALADDPAMRLVLPLAGADTGAHPAPADARARGAAAGLHDAAGDPRLIARLLALVATGGRAEGARGVIEGHLARPLGEPTGDGPAASLPESSGPIDVAGIGGDASNTSLVVTAGLRRLSMKIIRRCEAGLHPQVEIGRFFAERSPFAGTPALVGWLDYRPHGGPAATVMPAATIMIVEAFLEGRQTGWERLLERAERDWAGCLTDAGSLGRLTASMHAALAARDDDDAFRPRPLTSDEAAGVADALAGHAERALDRIARLARSPGMPLGPRLAGLAASRDTILARQSAVASALPAISRIRVHGDYHLGQVLVPRDADRPRDDEWAVIDFEGEPARPLAERRGQHPAVKDVAGMCRSFDYFARVAAREGRRPHDPRDVAALEAAFLGAYRARALGSRWWPEAPAEERRLLDAWKLDKCLYELLYECDNRPDWIEVPLAAVEMLASPAGG